MNEPYQNLLIKTKLLIPRRPQNVISRSHLIQKLHLSSKYKLTYIYSPVGFGKTTLLSEWIDQTHLPSTWLSLDERDNSPQLFLLYIATALQQIDESLSENTRHLIVNTPPISHEKILTSLINEIGESRVNFTLIMDDYHTITNPEIHEMMTFLLEYLPYQMHLIITSRKRLPFSLASLRAKNDLLEMTTRDLRFTHDETIAFLKNAMDLHLSSDDIEMLEKRTEGWITGLQLAALSLKESTNLTELLDNFAGDNQFVAEYLFEEIFNTQSDELKEYLLKTSILSQLTASLCDAVTGRDDSQTLLKTMGVSDLLIFPLDKKDEWYIYHQLFSDFLRATLEVKHPDLPFILHQRAAGWYEENGMLAEAVRHAAAINNHDQIAAILERNSQQMIARGELSTLQSWLELLPSDVIHSHGRLILTQAWVLVLLERQLDDAERILACLPDEERGDKQGEQELIAEATAIRANIACLRGDVERSIEFSNRALEMFHMDDSQLRGQMITNLSRAYRLQGDFQSWATFIERLGPASRTDIDYETRHAIIKGLATLLMAQGKLVQAEKIWQEGLTFVADLDKQGMQPISSTPFVMLGKIYVEWNRLADAEESIRRGLVIALRGNYSWSLRHGYINLARIMQIKGAIPEAIAIIEKAIHSGSSLDTVWTDRETKSYRAWLWLSAGMFDDVRAWAKESHLSIYSELEHSRKFEYIVYARYLLATNRAEDARFLLDRLYEMARRSERINTLMEILPLRASAAFACKHIQEALELLEEAILLGAPNRYTRTFIEAGPQAIELLRSALAADIQSQTIMHLLKEAGEDVSELMNELLSASPLSTREVEILRLLATRRSSTEIAGILGISTHTARTHIRNIYSKLDVHSRSEAIERVKEINLF